MADLTDSHIEYIILNIRKRGLASNLLFDEMVDHICCHIEARMKNGENFETAYKNCSDTIEKREIYKAQRNLSIMLNYRSWLTKGLLYLSLILYLLSWILHLGPIDWLSGISIVLLSLVFLRYSIVLYHDNQFKNNKALSLLAGLVFVLILSGGIIRFIALNYFIPNKHYSALLVAGYLLLSVLNVKYYFQCKKVISEGKSKYPYNVFFIFSVIHMGMAIFSMTTFFVPFLLSYVPFLAGIIVIYDIIIFIVLLFIRKRGKYILQGLILGSFITIFIYFPFKSIIERQQYNVIFRLITEEAPQTDQMYLYINYFKYGKECLTLYKINDTVYQSQPVLFHAGGIDMSYKISNDLLDINKVLLDKTIKEDRIKLEHNDTIYNLKK